MEKKFKLIADVKVHSNYSLCRFIIFHDYHVALWKKPIKVLY